LATSFLVKYIKQEFKAKSIKDDYSVAKAQLYQMYFIINRLDIEKFCRLDFIMNFGVQHEIKNQIADLIQNGGDYKECCAVFKSIDVLMLLKISKYLSWADKKLHSIFFIEDKD